MTLKQLPEAGSQDWAPGEPAAKKPTPHQPVRARASGIGVSGSRFGRYHHHRGACVCCPCLSSSHRLSACTYELIDFFLSLAFISLTPHPFSGSLPKAPYSATPVQPFPLHSPSLNTQGRSLKMPDWREEFLAGIIETEQQNPVNRELVDACLCHALSDQPRVAIRDPLTLPPTQALNSPTA